MTTPLQFFNYLNGALSCENLPIVDLTRSHGTPLYVYSTDAFLQPLKELQFGLRELDHLICFALKSNSNLSITKLLTEAGAGLDLVTGGELHRAARAQVPAEKIVFSGVGKSKDEMKDALGYSGVGIFSFNVESLPELMALNDLAISLKKKARVALRFNPDVDPKTHPYISTGLKKNKFGMEKKEILDFVKNLKNFGGIELKGLSIHIGSQLLTLAPLNDAFTRLKKLVDEINPLLPAPLSFVDLGGGVGITYKNEKAPPLKQYCSLIRKHFGKPMAKTGHTLKVLIEPGRTLSGNSGILVTQILYRKKRRNKDFLIVDAGMNDLIRPALYSSYHHIIPLKEPMLRAKTRKFDIVGPVCESADCFASDRVLPDELQEGDYLAILSAGAYGFTMASNYNSRPRPAELLVEQGDYRVIRDRESYDDLLRGERI